MVKFYSWSNVLILLLLSCLSVFAQNGKLSGTVTDSKTKEPVPFATIRVLSGGQLKGGAQADISGYYMVSPLIPGTYDVEFSSVGYNKQTVKGVIVNFETTTRLDFKISPNDVQLKTVEVVYEKDLISKDETSSGGKLTAKEIEKLPTRNVNTIIQTQAAVYSSDDGDGLNIRGNREDDNAVFINGIRQFGTRLPPVEAIQELSIITAGVPAQYGDALGGIISITTKSAARNFSGNVQAESSSPFDQWHYNFVGGTLSGPLLKTGGGPDENGVVREARTKIGFFSALQYTYNRDGNPSPYGIYVPNDAARQRVENGEIRKFGQTYLPIANFFEPSDIRKIKYRPNAASNSIQFNTNIDFQPTEDMLLTVGGNLNYSNSRLGSNFNLFNYQNNTQRIDRDYNVFARFRQSFKNLGGDSSILKNIYYQVQVDYTNRTVTSWDPRFKRNLNEYNYTGQFVPILGDFELPRVPGINKIFIQKNSTLGFDYVPTSINKELSAFNQSIENTFTDGITNPFEFFNRGAIPNGLSNGNMPDMGYQFNFAGRYSTRFSISNQTQFRVSGQIAADVKRHSLKMGFEYEDRGIASFQSSSSLYDRGRILVNGHIRNDTVTTTRTFLELRPNPNNPSITDSVFVLNSTAEVNEFDGKLIGQSNFDKNLRNRLGFAPNQSINIDGLTPDKFSLNDFSVSEIFNNGNAPLSNWSGYDAYGKKVRGRKTSFNSFFTDTLNRPVAAFRPNYLAFFIEDKFEINDLIVRLGLRVDRFDANQQVPIDLYSLTKLKTVGETDASKFRQDGGVPYQYPGNVGSDWAVYVDKPAEGFNGNQGDFRVLGFRNGSKWYDRNGLEVENPTQSIAVNGRVNPWFDITGLSGTEKTLQRETGITLNAFRDFKPQWNFLPRVAFSFPISDEATFFAHYDILTQRPLGVVPNDNSLNDPGSLDQNFGSPYDYYRLRTTSGDFIHNSNLRPQKKIDYQLGFQQRLTQKSALKLTAFYSEIKDLIQVINVLNAYPLRYRTNGNLDFSTVKGMTIQYDLRRTSNFTINTSYTLQFAEGSGSNFANALLNTSSPNLRTTVPQNFDQRHAIKLNLDFRFRKGEGPEVFGVYPLENVGINTTFFTGSGTPFTRNGAPQGGRFQIKGQINGDRLPWNNRTSLRIDKSFTFKKEGSQKEKFLNVYLYVTNIFNAQNVLAVYSRTGSAVNDGFLNSDFGRSTVQSQPSPETYAYFYNMTMVNPDNISLPRRFRLGLSYNF